MIACAEPVVYILSLAYAAFSLNVRITWMYCQVPVPVKAVDDRPISVSAAFLSLSCRIINAPVGAYTHTPPM